jgi:hypothetical protein
LELNDEDVVQPSAEEAVADVNEEVSTETEVEGESQETEAEGAESEGGEEARSKRPSHYQRMKRKLEMLERENEEMRRGGGNVPQFTSDEGLQVDIDPPPNEADYGGDWLAFQEDMTAWKTEWRIAAREARQQQRQYEAQAARAARERQLAFAERVDAVMRVVPDYQEVLSRARISMPEATLNIVRESDPMVAYHLAKNPHLAEDIGLMHPVQAAKAIGRIEAQVRLPQARTQTGAPRPGVALKGGAAAAPDPAKMSMADYAKWRAKGGGR